MVDFSGGVDEPVNMNIPLETDESMVPLA